MSEEKDEELFAMMAVAKTQQRAINQLIEEAKDAIEQVRTMKIEAAPHPTSKEILRSVDELKKSGAELSKQTESFEKIYGWSVMFYSFVGCSLSIILFLILYFVIR